MSTMPKVVSRTERAALRSKHEDTYQKMEDKVTPAPSTLENLFEVIDRSTGTIKVKKGAMQNLQPSGLEELRVRLDLMANAILMCAFRYPNKAAFQRITPNSFSRYANHLLGEHVFGRQKPQHGARKNKGHSWVDSLEEAMVDTLVKERFLTTPLACNSWVATKSRSRSRRTGSASLERTVLKDGTRESPTERGPAASRRGATRRKGRGTDTRRQADLLQAGKQ